MPALRNHRTRNLFPVVWLLLLFGLPARAGELVIEEARISVRLDPEAGALYGKALLTLRNRTGRDLAAVDLKFPAAAGDNVKLNVVWDRHEDLPWRRLWRQEALGHFLFQVTLAKPLRDGKKILLGVSFDLTPGTAGDDAPAIVTATRASLRGTGWYPVAAEGPAAPGRLKLTVRLPKTWVVTHPPGSKKKRPGILLADYKVNLGRKFTEEIVFAARAPEMP